MVAYLCPRVLQHFGVAVKVVDAHPDVAVNVADVSSHSDGAVNVVGTRTVTRCY